jgi:hypothetical protein
MSLSRPRAAGLLTLALSLTTLPAMAFAGTSSKQVWVTTGNSCRQERYKPSQIQLACVDGSETLQGLKWSSWNASRATGQGTDYVISCNPDCAAGHRTAYPVTVTLTKPKSCKGQRHRVFSHALLRFGQGHPGSRSTEADSLGCPL